MAAVVATAEAEERQETSGATDDTKKYYEYSGEYYNGGIRWVYI